MLSKQEVQCASNFSVYKIHYKEFYVQNHLCCASGTIFDGHLGYKVIFYSCSFLEFALLVWKDGTVFPSSENLRRGSGVRHLLGEGGMGRTLTPFCWLFSSSPGPSLLSSPWGLPAGSRTLTFYLATELAYSRGSESRGFLPRADFMGLAPASCYVTSAWNQTVKTKCETHHRSTLLPALSDLIRALGFTEWHTQSTAMLSDKDTEMASLQPLSFMFIFLTKKCKHLEKLLFLFWNFYFWRSNFTILAYLDWPGGNQENLNNCDIKETSVSVTLFPKICW